MTTAIKSVSQEVDYPSERTVYPVIDINEISEYSDELTWRIMELIENRQVSKERCAEILNIDLVTVHNRLLTYYEKVVRELTYENLKLNGDLVELRKAGRMFEKLVEKVMKLNSKVH